MLMALRPRLAVVAFVFCSSCFVVQSNAFQTSTVGSVNTRQGWFNSRAMKENLPFLRGSKGDNDSMGDMSELTSALARIDKQWQIQQRKGGSRWTKVYLEQDDGSSSKDPDDIVYMLEPESVIPSSRVICFVGGAGLGQFPHIAYSEFLERVSTKLNAVILTVPYQVGLDHFTLAKQTGERLGQAMIQCVEKRFKQDYKTYCMAHSLGAKLTTIHMAATGQQYDGVGFLCFNNFGFAKTISMARSFAQQLKAGFAGEDAANESDKQSDGEDFLGAIFELAETVVDAIGVEFSPSPRDMERLIELKYNAVNATRLFLFDDDTLDDSRNFYEACSRNEQEENDGPSLAALPGTHLTPVYFKFSFDELPQEAQEFATEAGVPIKSASFGNEEHLNLLVDEVYDWIMGDDPTRTPSWEEKDAWEGQRRITGGVANADVD